MREKLLFIILLFTIVSILSISAHAESSDPGQDSSLFLQSANINGQSISPSNRVVNVAPGQSIAGSAILLYNSAWPTSINTPLGVTRTWDSPQTGFMGFGDARGSGSKAVNFHYIAPTTPGAYYLVFAFRAEIDYGDVFSMTNWAYDFGEKWGDGNDIASWSSAMISSANSDGKVQGLVLFDDGYKNTFIPATAIGVRVVDPACEMDETATVIDVSSRQAWTDTGLDLSPGDIVSISASGTVRYDSAGRTTGPDGTDAAPGQCFHLVTSSNVPVHSLAGNIAGSSSLDGKGFFVGSTFCGKVPIDGTSSQAGKLFLGFNDGFVKCDRSGLDDGAVGDNSGSFTAKIKIKKANQPDASDPGGTSSLTLASGNINGQTVSSSVREIVVGPGEKISGAVNLAYNSTWGSNAVMAFGATPNWGDHQSSYVNYGSVNTPASGNKNVNVDFAAPTAPGTYYLTFAYRAEFTTGQVFSMTNWPYGNDVWNDGNDIADWTATQINDANANGRTVGYILTTQGYRPFWVPATALKITVRDCVQAQECSSLNLVSGNINGQSISSSNRKITVNAGQSISGTLTVSYATSYPSNDVVALGATPNWGDHASSFVSHGTLSTPTSGSKTVNVNVVAPTTPGTYYYILAYNTEFNAGQVMSMTNWGYCCGNVWNDGNDVADWSTSQINYANANGKVIAKRLWGSGSYDHVFVAANAIEINVVDNPANSGDPGYTSRLKFNSGNLNGKPLSPSDRVLTADPGQSITGNLNFNYDSTYGSNAVMVFASTSSWGDHDSSCIYQSSVPTPGTGTLTANVNTIAPTTPGTYHLIFQYRGEFNEDQVCSMTNWAARNGASVYNDGNDMADWTQSIINDAKGDGNALATILHSDGFRPWYVPADAIDIVVRPPTQDILYRETFDGTGTLPQGWSKIPGFEQGIFSTQLNNGVLRVTGNEQGNIGIAYFGGLSLPDNYTLTARLRLLQRIAKPTSDQALVFVNLKYYSATSNQQFLEAGWRQNQNNDFFITGAGTTYDLGHVTSDFSFEESLWHAIKIVKKGNQFQLFINEIPGISLTLPAGITGGTIGLQLSQGIFEIDEIIVTGKPGSSGSGNICHNTLNGLPVQCKSSTLTQDTKSGCRTVQCSTGSNSVKIGACEKTDSQGKFFEMYRQSFTGTPPEVCLANDCLRPGWGYEKGDYFPVCTQSPSCTPSGEICDGKDNDCDNQIDEGNVCQPSCTPTNEICDSKDNDCDGQIDENNVCGQKCYSAVKDIPAACSASITQDTLSGTCRTISCGSGSNSIKVLSCDKPDTGTKTFFEMYRQSYSGTIPKVCLENVCIQNEGYKKSSNYPICN